MSAEQLRLDGRYFKPDFIRRIPFYELGEEWTFRQLESGRIENCMVGNLLLALTSQRGYPGIDRTGHFEASMRFMHEGLRRKSHEIHETARELWDVIRPISVLEIVREERVA